MRSLFSNQARCFIGTCAMLCAIVAGGAVAPWALAQMPPQQKAQAPGFFRMPLGTLEVTALYDGFVEIDTALLGGASKKTIQSALARSFLTNARPLRTAVNAYLVHTGSHLILVDTGTAKLFGANLGFVIDNLRAAGYAPEQVDTVLLTHLHPDHTGGLLTPAGDMAFPHAQVFVAKADADYWLNETVAARAPKDQQALFAMSRNAVAPYRAAGRLTVFEPGQALREGVTALPASGHTPGHIAYLFASQGQRLLVWGDVMHSAAVQFAHPEVAIEFDWDKEKAVATRKSLLARAASRQLWVAGAHLPFPGMGRVHADKATYHWVPVEYQPFRGRQQAGGTAGR